jgi:hypothetical protein
MLSRAFVFVGALLLTGHLMALPTLRLIQTAGVSAGADSGDISSATGITGFTGPLGDFTLNLATGTTKPAIGTATNPQLQITDFSSTIGDTGGTLLIALTETSFTLPIASALGILDASLTALTGGSVSAVYEVYLDVVNRHFGGAGIAGVDGSSSFLPFLTASATDPLGGGSTAAADTDPISGPLGPYSLTLVEGANTTAQLTHGYSQVPEPGFYGLLALGFSGLLFFNRRRKVAATRE